MRKTKVVYYTDNSGKSPVLKFIDSLPISQQAKIRRAINPIVEFGVGNHLRNTKKLRGTPLWEIRILGKNNIRILYAIEIVGVVLMLHGFIKKKQKTPKKEIKTALNRLMDARDNLT